MNTNKSLEMFKNAPVHKLVLQNAISAMIAMVMVLVYNLADTFFISQTHNDLQVAAVSLATPVSLLFMAAGTIFGVGGSSVISRVLGEGKTDYAKKICSFCMWSCILVGLVMSALLLIFMTPILNLISASENTWTYTKTYLTIVSFSGPFVMISTAYSNILRAEGKPQEAMIGQILGNLVNIVLDPLMITVFKWDIAGAAIATVAGNVVGTLYYIGYFLRKQSMLSINIKDFSIRNKVASSVLIIGIPSSLGSLLISISSMIMNNQMASYGDMAVAAVGVAMKVTMVTGMLCIGIGQGIQPLLGYCAGAKQWDRYKSILNFSLIFAFIVSLVLTGLCYMYTKQIVSVFLTDTKAFNYGVTFSHILLSTSFLFGVFYVLTNALQACGAATESFIVNISRQGLIYIPAMFILKAVFRENGLLFAQPLADVLSLILVSILYIRMIKKNVPESEKIKEPITILE